MKIIAKSKNKYVLCFEKGERWPDAFLVFCEDENITGAFFCGLGGCVDPEIAYYDLEGEQKYIHKTLNGVYEILNLTGNVAVKDGELLVHNHITLGREDYGVVGGHLVSMTVGGTLELRVEVLNDTIERKLDDETKLTLMSD